MPEEELRSLHQWLLADPSARRCARPRLDSSRSLPPGAQGDVIDLVSLIVGSGFSAASLAVSLAGWRATRPQNPTVTLDRPDGGSITISASSPDEVRRFIEELSADAVDGDDHSA
ncbi:MULTISPECIES: effector-associated constant component EACC1 [unclassified Streptomyces]|uniref:effector-associated constant component EACC1 n=1 Tax=unclassified Streptomyces TaxID=2593676 RepID=UPI001CB6E45C|nr:MULTISPECIES: hypothetical protein [unclassified Streptomyces]